MSKRKQIDAIPDEFAAADEAAEFWDTHDTTDYPRAFRTIRVVAELRNRHYEISIEADVAETVSEHPTPDPAAERCGLAGSGKRPNRCTHILTTPDKAAR